MKFIAAGQTKESLFYDKRSRVLFYLIVPIVVGFQLPLFFGGEEIFAWKSTLQMFGIVSIFEILYGVFSKKENLEGMLSLELLEDEIIMKYADSSKTVIQHSQIDSINKDITKIVFRVSNEATEYNIHYYNFTYNDLQKIKVVFDRISQKISTLPKENPAFS